MHRLIPTVALGLIGYTGLATAQTESIVILTTYPATGSLQHRDEDHCAETSGIPGPRDRA